MNTKKLLLAALLGAALGSAGAGEFDEDQLRVVERHEVRMAGMEDGPMLAGPLMRMQHKVVKGAPYSAEMINERQQNLADGNQISSKSLAMSYRDGAGRTRQERTDANGEVRSVVIHDPVAGTAITLNPKDKTATRIAIKEIAGEAREMARKHIEKMRKDGKLPAEGKQNELVTVQRSEGKDGEEIVVKRVERVDGEPRERRERIREEVRVRIAEAMGQERHARFAELDKLGPMLAGAFGDMKWSGKASSKELGSKEFDGVKADGKLRSYEIPAGAMGNKNPIVVSDESWYSPELQLTVYAKHSDPRSGERTFRLGKLNRTEPAATLFAIPSDYTVREAAANIKKRIIEKK